MSIRFYDPSFLAGKARIRHSKSCWVSEMLYFPSILFKSF